MRAASMMPALLRSIPAATAADPPKKNLPPIGEVFELSGRTAFLLHAKADGGEFRENGARAFT